VSDKEATAPPGNYQTKDGARKALSTPAVRHIAKKEGLDINRVPGSGKNGRVTKSDILSFIKDGGVSSKQGQTAAPATRSGFGYTGPKIARLEGITELDK